MDTFPIIAFIDAHTATSRRVRGARTDDRSERTARVPADAAQPRRKRSENATRSTGGAPTGSPSRVTA